MQAHGHSDGLVVQFQPTACDRQSQQPVTCLIHIFYKFPGNCFFGAVCLSAYSRTANTLLRVHIKPCYVKSSYQSVNLLTQSGNVSPVVRVPSGSISLAVTTKNFDKRPNHRHKFTDEQNRTARKSHCECTSVERQQCIADTVVRRRSGPRRLSDHDECIARVGQQFIAPAAPTRLSKHPS